MGGTGVEEALGSLLRWWGTPVNVRGRGWLSGYM
jgi:hypothetical protein